MRKKRGSVLWLCSALLLAAGMFWPVWTLAQPAWDNDRFPVTAHEGQAPLAVTATLYLPFMAGGTEVVTTVVDMGSLMDEFLATETLGRGEIHRWEIEFAVSDTITAFATALPGDGVLTLLNGQGEVLARQDGTTAGEVETIHYTAVTSDTYYLQVSSVNFVPTHYSLLYLNTGSYHFVPRGSLQYGAPVSASLPANQDNFWYFLGSAGDHITITVTPDAASDAFFRLYDPAVELLLGFVDDGGTGAAETAFVVLDSDGLYTLQTGEFDFLPMQYTVLVTKE